MSKSQKLVYDIALAILGMVLIASATALFFSHFRLGEFDSTMGQASLIFSENAQDEYEAMETIRVISGAVLVTSLAVITVLSYKYYQLVPDPEWEMKKGLVGGIGLIIFGGGFYYIAPDLIMESLALALLLMGLYVTLGDSAILLVTSDGPSGSSNADAYCSGCGKGVSKSDSYCPDCGSQL